MSRAALLLAVLISAPAALASADRPPQVVSQKDPEYPFSMRLSGNRGKVVLQFVVDPNGDVVKVEVVSSSHPDFEAPAVEALLKWKFKPGLKDGRPVFARMQVPIIFLLNGAGLDYYSASRPGDYEHEGHGVETWRVPERPAAGVPEDFQYDEPPKPQITSAPVYPYDLLTEKVTGKASVMFMVDPLGRVHVAKLLSASRPEFGQSIQAMVEAWTFSPARRKGKPCWAILRKNETFEPDSEDFPLGESPERLLKVLRKYPSAILASRAQVAALDQPLRLRFSPSPVVPDSVRAKGADQDALIEFIVDHAGHAQLPRIVSATDTQFGWAAATAVGRWQYTIPSVKGRPVDVKIEVPIHFAGHSAPAAAP